MLWFAPCTAARGALQIFDLGLKCFSDTSVDILFDFVNALKMPPPDHRSVDLISDAPPLVGSVMAD